MPRKLDASRLTGALGQFRRRSLAGSVAVSALLLALGIATGPSDTFGIVAISLSTGVIASAVVAAVALEREDFAQAILDLGVQSLFQDRKSEFEDSYWLELLRSANSSFRVLGVANHGYLNDAQAQDETRQQFSQAVRDHKTIELLWLKPDNNPAAEMREAEEARSTRKDIVNAILFFWELRESFTPEQQQRFSLKEYTALPTCGITWADNQLVVTHYLSGRLNLRAPGFVLGSSLLRYDRFLKAVGLSQETSPPLAQVYARNYREVSTNATEITGDRIAELTAFVGTLPALPSESEFRSQEAST